MSSQSKDGVLAVTGSLLGLSSIAVALRVHARKKQHLPLKLDDIFAFLALSLYLVASAVIIWEVSIKAVGYAFQDISPAELGALMKRLRLLGLAWNVIAALTVFFIKLSALFFYRRIFCICGIRQPIDALTIGTAVLCVMWVLTYIILPFFQCGMHLNAGWNGQFEKYCQAENPYFLSLVFSNLILDIWILLLPIPNIIKLRISTGKKFSVLGVFLLAFSGLGASVARAVTYFQVINGGATYSEKHDLGLAGTKAAYFTMLEAGLCLVAVNLPSLWFLFTSIIPERAIRSLRSVLSLSSMRSEKSDTVQKVPSVTKQFEITTEIVEFPTSQQKQACGFPSDTEMNRI